MAKKSAKKGKRAARSAAAARPDWSSVTWEKLGDWAGSRTVTRGRDYRRQGAVVDLGISDEGELVAWVVGSARYATRVRCDDSGGEGALVLDSSCSCPVGRGCKHAVATILTALEDFVSDDELPRVAASDPRWELAGGDRAAGARVTGTKAKRTRPGDLGTFVSSLDKPKLVELILGIVARHPDVGTELKRLLEISSGDVEAIVERLRAEIEVVSAEQAWSDSWRGHGNVPDYAPIQTGLQQLLDGGHADAVIELGEEVFVRGKEQVLNSHDDGQTGIAIAECMRVVFRALLECSMEDHEKILYAIDISMVDDYGLADGADMVLDARWSQSTWSAVADALEPRVKLESAGGDYAETYRRRRLAHWLVRALDGAGRTHDVDSVLFSEAATTGDYEPLVQRLITEKRFDDAKEWAERGVAALLESAPGTAARLHETLRELARRRRQWPLAAAYAAEHFFYRPDVERLEGLLKAAEKAGCRDAVRTAALDYLESGRRPGDASHWPLPSTDIKWKHPHAAPRDRSTRWQVLRDFAMREGRPDDVLHWHGQLVSRGRGSAFSDDRVDLRVADAVAATHPDRALEIYLSAADQRIRRTHVEAYREAGVILGRVRDTLATAGRSTEFTSLLAGIRASHHRKRRLMEILDGLESKPIARRRR